VEVAQGRDVVEFGTRRAHGPEAGTLAARAAYLGGCVGTSNVEAGRRFGIPIFGTMAHSFIMAYDDEEESFRLFSACFLNMPPCWLIPTTRWRRSTKSSR